MRATVRSPINRPAAFSIGVSRMRPTDGMRPATRWSGARSAPAPVTSYRAHWAISYALAAVPAVAGDLVSPPAPPDRRHLLGQGRLGVGRVERLLSAMVGAPCSVQ